MDTETQSMKGIPDGEVDRAVRLLKADPNYVSHTVIPEGGGTNTIQVVLRKPPPPDDKS